MIWRVRSRHVFAELSANGRRARSGALRVTFVPLDTEHPQLAMAVGRRFGNAVERNRCRRRIRAAFAATWDPKAPVSGAFLVSASRSLLDAPFSEVEASVADCLRQLELRPQRPEPMEALA